MYCQTPGCGFAFLNAASAAAIVHCPKCGGSFFSNVWNGASVTTAPNLERLELHKVKE